MTTKALLAAVFGLLLALSTALEPMPGFAQQRGQVRIQGRDATPSWMPEDKPKPLVKLDKSIDPREEMRRFVLRISTFAHKYNRNFQVVPQNGLSLIDTAGAAADRKAVPDPAYTQAINGVLQEGLFFGIPDPDKPTADDRRKRLLALTENVRNQHLKVLVMDYGKNSRTVREADRLIAAKGYVPYVAPARGPQLKTLPAYARYPYAENSDSILSLTDARNFVYLRDTSSYGLQDQFTAKIHDTNFDVVVVDVFHRPGEPFTRESVDAMRFKKLGAQRLVFAYMDIGEADSSRYYWKPEWKPGEPEWLIGPVDGRPGKYHVRYWNKDWQSIFSGDTQSYVYGIIMQGFDGVVLGGMEEFRYFDGTEESPASTF